MRLPERRDRQFAAKANAFNAAYATLKDGEWDVIGNLDADITFDEAYFAFLLGRFSAEPELGVAGTPFVEDEERTDQHTYAHQFAQLDHVSGACQLFRRTCFEGVGGYTPIKGGAIDWMAVTTARMNGWKTRTFTEKVCFHHRKLGTGNNSPWMVRFHYGRKAYYVGGHPLWEMIRGVFQMRHKPLCDRRPALSSRLPLGLPDPHPQGCEPETHGLSPLGANEPIAALSAAAFAGNSQSSAPTA